MTPQDKRYPEYQRLCTEIMELENVTYVDGVLSHGRSSLSPAPTYLDASIDAVVRKLDNDSKYLYFDCLTLAISTEEEWADQTQAGEQKRFIKCLTALPEQKAEALSRTIMGEAR